MVMEMTMLIILGALAGGWLDKKLQTSPLLLLLALGAALTLGMFRIIHTLDRLSPPEKTDEDHPPEHHP